MAKHLKSILVVSVTTLGSRVLGLVRDQLAGVFFGLGGINSAFNWAWMVPNLFRRMVGEGALSSAFIPVLSQALDKGGREEAFRFLNQVLTRLVVALLALVTLGLVLMAAFGFASAKAAQHIPELQQVANGLGLPRHLRELQHYAGGWGLSFNVPQWKDFAETMARWQLGSKFGLLMMPYLLLVCVTAALLGALNVLGHFAVSGMSQVWLNISMIFSLGVFGKFFGLPDLELMYWQCGAVLFGGLLQVTMPTTVLWREGWRPRWDWTLTPRLREMMRIFLPGLLGASIIQINIAVSRFVAFGLNDSATSVLYFSQRLMELPLGMFSIAVATVIFPKIALLAEQDDREGMGRTYAQGLRLIMALTVPASLGLVVLREPIVRLLFQHGKLDAAQAAEMMPVLAISALAIPFFSLAMLSTRGFYAQKDMATPVYVAKIDFFLNIGLTLLLMFPFGTSGLALANLASSIFQCFMLQRLLLRGGTALARPKIGRAVVIVALAGAGMAAFAVAGWWGLRTLLGEMDIASLAGHTRRFSLGETKLADLAAVIGLIPAAVIVYLGLLQALKFEELPQLRDLAARIFPRRR